MTSKKRKPVKRDTETVRLLSDNFHTQIVTALDTAKEAALLHYDALRDGYLPEAERARMLKGALRVLTESLLEAGKLTTMLGGK